VGGDELQQKTFILLLIPLAILAIVTSPPVLRPFLQPEPTPTATAVIPTATPTATITPDPFAAVPTATPRADGVIIEVQALPSPALGELPPTFTPTPVATLVSEAPRVLLPDPLIAAQSMTDETISKSLLVPTPAGIPPDRLSIPRLALDVEVVPAGMVPVPGPGALVTIAMPPGKVAGWLTTSAGFGRVGNTVLTGRHQARGLTVFHGLWTLEPGDEIVLYAGEQARRYVVDEVLVVPEQDQPLDVRLANAEYIKPTEDERLTLVTGWPEKGNTHRTIVIALPMMNDER